MKKILLAFSITFILIAANAQQKIVNDANAQIRTVTAFHAIRVSTGIHLYLTQGNEEKVAVSADNTEHRDKIRTEVVNGVLRIYYNNGHHWFSDDWDKSLKAYVSCKTLDALNASSGAHVEVDGSIHSNTLDLDFSSGAWFKGSVNVSGLTIDEGSGAHSVISGSANDIKASASSGSHLDAFDLVTNQCDADASSGGHIDVNVSKALVASASSGGHISYKGDASVKNINTSSGGAVSKR
ncbi:MAG TPA: head GIN domain-containing protein [Puia sp.]|jgi:hypothetical protein|nr:head GIN domain-containing protein [Puia sp.]